MAAKAYRELVAIVKKPRQEWEEMLEEESRLTKWAKFHEEVVELLGRSGRYVGASATDPQRTAACIQRCVGTSNFLGTGLGANAMRGLIDDRMLTLPPTDIPKGGLAVCGGDSALHA